MQRVLQSLRQDLANAKTELTALMGMKPGTPFELADVQNLQFIVPELNTTIEHMEELALTKRPELVESHYQKRISAAETRAALLKMLPGISLNAGVYYDDNDYLLNQDWTSIGAQVSWNLVDIFKFGAEQRLATTREGLAEAQRLATSMAVLTQVHLAISVTSRLATLTTLLSATWRYQIVSANRPTTSPGWNERPNWSEFASR